MICMIVQYKCPTRPTHSRAPLLVCRTSPPPPGRGERPQGNARRLLLLQTTLRLIADEGIDAVSHRSVAEAAGVPARLDYLLVLLAPGHAAPGARVLRAAGDRDASGSTSTPSSAGASRASGWSTSSPTCCCPSSARPAGARSHSTRCCRRRPAGRSSSRSAASGRWRGSEALVEVFELAGQHRDPGLEARMFLAMLDGLLLEQLATPDAESERRRDPACASHLVRPRPRSSVMTPASPRRGTRRLRGSAGARGLRKQRHRERGGNDDHPDRNGEGQAQRRSHDLELGALHRQEDDPGVRAGDWHQRPLHRGHQQLRRVLRQDAAAARPGPVRRPVADGGDRLARQEDVRPRLHPAARQARCSRRLFRTSTPTSRPRARTPTGPSPSPGRAG